MTVREKAELIVKDIKKEQETNPVIIGQADGRRT